MKFQFLIMENEWNLWHLTGYGSGGGASSTYSVGSSGQSGAPNNRFYEDSQQPGTSHQINAVGGYPFQDDQNIHQPYSSILMDEEPLSYNSRPAQSSASNKGGSRRLSATSQQQQQPQRNSWGSTVQGMDEDYGVSTSFPKGKLLMFIGIHLRGS